MQVAIQTPRKFLNPLLSQKGVVATDVAAFKAALDEYVQSVKQLRAEKQTEPNIVSGALMPFLKATPLVYNCRPYSQRGQSGIDLVILDGNDVSVIIEAKIVGSKDMITAHDLNKKSFHEAIFYFMQERERGNDKLTHIAITDFYEWFVFDAKDFDRLFWRNAQLKKTFNAYHAPNVLTRKTSEVYAAIEQVLPQMLSDLITEEYIDCAYFNLAEHDLITEKELTAIYKLLSPDCLLKAYNPNDANSLNREFYNELLYILGLQEVKDGSKRVIQNANTAGSLYDGIADKLNQKGAPDAFENVIKLIIIWINRVLFLKLLESQIVTWTDKKTSRFLNATKISSYAALENLFFDTLARRISDRKNKGFDYIPYLNSSLFEMQEEEKIGISISALSDSAQIFYYPKTVVKDATTKRKAGQTQTLAYLFEFLDAYDFANDNEDEVRTETKSLISASVLGLIFEKINGYKDGSFYTPSFVTMYMARQTIEKAVLQKFNEKYNWSCTALVGESGLKNELKDHKVTKIESNGLIDSLKICDPAVGSGHFLVSALNEILYIKSMLGLLVDETGNRIDYSVSIENDELIVTSDNGELFEYKRGSQAKTRVQKTLFQEKQKIIENCLFGVDINPNSVNICRLRLWIELLKNAYYQPDGELDTLPNIDINIKCGNSLISRFALDSDLKVALKKSNISVEDYRNAVSDYRNTSDKAKKRQIETLIENIKNNFRTEIQYYDPKQKRLIDLPKIIKTLEFSQSLLDETVKEKNNRKQQQAKLKAELAKLSLEIDEIKNNKIYIDAFEWRFEFPEILDEVGEFIGFDVVIGNPPYIFARENFTTQEKNYFVSSYQLSAYQINLYILFLEKCSHILKAKGKLTLIVPNNWLTINSAKKVREFILANSDINIINFTEKVFNEASVDTTIISYTKSNESPIVYLYESSSSSGINFINKTKSEYFLKKTDVIINIEEFKNTNIYALIEKIEKKASALSEISDIKAGLQAYETGKGVPIQSDEMKNKRVYHSQFAIDDTYFYYLDGKDVSRYELGWSGEFLKYGSNLAAARKWLLFSTPRILVRQIPAQPPYCIHACFTQEIKLNDRNSMNIINIKENPLYVLSLLNSRLLSFWFIHKFGKLQRGIFPQFKINELEQFPIAACSHQDLFGTKVKAILENKSRGEDTVKLEQEIDDMVYRIYDLTYDEVKIIDPDYNRLSREEYKIAM